MSTLGVISNPTAGSGRGAAASAQTMALLAARGHQVQDLSMGSWAASLDNARSRRSELDALVVVGGDGMTHLGLQACAETSTPLGIVAVGSGNDVAASLGLPVHDVPAGVAAIELGLAGDIATIDLGRVDGEGLAGRSGARYFGAVLSAGIDAAIAARANRSTWPRGPVKYKVATLRELPGFKPYGVSLVVDGEQGEQQCTLVAVANGPVFGGSLLISPESSHTDGILELVLADPMRPLAAARLFPSLKDGSHLRDTRVKVVRATHVRIGPLAAGTAAGDEAAPLPPAFADGELIGPAPFDVRVVPASLRVLGGKADNLKA